MTSWKGLSSFWKSSLTPQQLRMPSLNKVEFLSIGISVIALAIIGTAIQVLSFLILCKRQFRKFHLTPYFLNIALANVLVITVDLPAVAISAFAEKQLMGDIFCQVRLIDQSWHRHAHTGQKKTFNLTNGKQINLNHGALATLNLSNFQTAWILFMQSGAEIRGSGNHYG